MQTTFSDYLGKILRVEWSYAKDRNKKINDLCLSQNLGFVHR